jgi:multiple sugar transport system substrate-binding protein
MKRLSRIVSVVLTLSMLAVLVMGLGGCGTQKADQKGTETVQSSEAGTAETSTSNFEVTTPSEPVTLKYTYWGGNLEKKTTDAQVAEFEKTHPNVTVDAQQIPTDYLTKLNTMVASNTLPDVAYMSEGALVNWAEKGMFLKQPVDMEAGKKLETLQFKNKAGEVVSTSVANEIMVLYYNKDLFQKAGMETPPADANNAWTWDKMIEVAQALTVDKNGKHPTDSGFDANNIVTYGFNIPKWEMGWLPFLMSNGGGIVSTDGKELLFGKQETIDALQKVADLATKYHVCPSPAQSSAVPATDTALMTNKVAMTVDGQWACQVLGQAKIDKNLNFGIGVLPKLKDPVTTNSGTGIVVFNTTKHEKEAMEFARFVMSPENSLEFINGGLWMPNQEDWYTDQSLIDKWTANNNAFHPAEYKTAVIDYALNNVVQEPWYYLAYHDELLNIINPALDNLWAGKDTAENVVKGIMPQLQAIFDKNK